MTIIKPRIVEGGAIIDQDDMSMEEYSVRAKKMMGREYKEMVRPCSDLNIQIDTIYAIIGGFHTEMTSGPNIDTIIEHIETFNPRIVCGMHCTGLQCRSLAIISQDR